MASPREKAANQHLWSEILGIAGFSIESQEETGKGSKTLWVLDDDSNIRYLDLGDSEHLFRADEKGELSFPIEYISKYDAIRLLHFDGDPNSTLDFLRSGALLTRTIFEMVGADLKSRLSELEASERYVEDPNFRSKVDKEILRMHSADYATRIYQQSRFEEEDKTPPAMNLDEFLSKPLSPEKYLINGILPTGGTVTVVAAKKTGKSTFVYNVIHSLLTRQPLLGCFEVNEFEGRIGFVNYELTEEQAQDWFRRSPIPPSSQISVWNLRGKPNPFRTDSALTEFAKELRELNIRVLILDPFSSAFRGGNSQDNDEVKEFWLRTDWLKEASGVSELIVPVHAGRNESRSRGASSLDDHPDAILHLNLQSDGTRTFKAIGRDVEVEEGELAFDKSTLTLTYLGASTYESRLDKIAKEIVIALQGSGSLSAGEITLKVSRNKDDTKRAREKLVATGEIVETSIGNSKFYQLPPNKPLPEMPEAPRGWA